MDLWREFPGPNAAYVLKLYERYRRDPASVDPEARAAFAAWTPPEPASAPAGEPAPACDAVVGVVRLAEAIRGYGHLAARLDPLGRPPHGDPSLDPAAHGLSEEQLRQLPASLVGGPAAEGAASAWEAIQALRQVYAGSSGHRYRHLQEPEEREWLRQAVESRRFLPPRDPINAPAILERLTEVEVFERFLHRVFPGKTRFSIEGLDMLVPVLDELIGEAAEAGIRNVIIGMAHRGRLNVLAHVLHRPYAQILADFKDPARGRRFTVREDLSWTGDVKYHMGARRAVSGGEEVELVVSMPPNPSHLEAVNPVVLGMARAAGTQVDGPGVARFNPRVSLPVLVHGDAAFPGQGVVAETLNLSRLCGYYTGGTIHLIANNQLGYTTEPFDERSTLYAGDLAKGFEIPIVHVNADDPEACIQAARLAHAYRSRFRKDFLIDLVGYRRQGHNEGDEPAFTQPQLYERIQAHPTVRDLWASALVQRGVVPPGRPKALVERATEVLEQTLARLQPERDLVEPFPSPPPPGAARRVRTAVSMQRLRELSEGLRQLPEGFSLHPKLARALQRRREALADADARTIDWAAAEELALASILADGVSVRLTGQDVERGTFGHRHAVLHDTKTGQLFTPLQALPQARASFSVFNSPLSEAAALGFEYGYNVQAPERLVLWEAQYGDFINGAQVVVDAFLMSARAKWGQTPSLALLLPHGYEGQGPEHSSARLERFLELAAEMNVRIANCTTAAQYFHLLRRQAALLRTDPLPLVVLTPKSLLRHPLAASSLREVAEGQWRPALDDPEARTRRSRAEAVLLCSGKIAVDLLTSPHRAERQDTAIVRLEQIYPFPAGELQALLGAYPRCGRLIWVQEEPENMGAWRHLQPELRALCGERRRLHFVARPANSSPAEGSSAWHAANQAALIAHAFERPAGGDGIIASSLGEPARGRSRQP
ncbi:MAG: 2-oxoglutarate dehydrogenase E1 component [Candidatus Methylomirabilales bacterium]